MTSIWVTTCNTISLDRLSNADTPPLFQTSEPCICDMPVFSPLPHTLRPESNASAARATGEIRLACRIGGKPDGRHVLSRRWHGREGECTRHGRGRWRKHRAWVRSQSRARARTRTTGFAAVAAALVARGGVRRRGGGGRLCRCSCWGRAEGRASRHVAAQGDGEPGDEQSGEDAEGDIGQHDEGEPVVGFHGLSARRARVSCCQAECVFFCGRARGILGKCRPSVNLSSQLES